MQHAHDIDAIGRVAVVDDMVPRAEGTEAVLQFHTPSAKVRRRSDLFESYSKFKQIVARLPRTPGLQRVGADAPKVGLRRLRQPIARHESELFGLFDQRLHERLPLHAVARVKLIETDLEFGA